MRLDLEPPENNSENRQKLDIQEKCTDVGAARKEMRFDAWCKIRMLICWIKGFEWQAIIKHA